MAKFIPSQKGHRKLVIDEYLFTKESNGAQNKEYWVCEVRRCPSRVHILSDVVIKGPTEHNHAPRHGKAAVEEVRAHMKQRAEVTEERTRQIVHQALAQVNLNHAHHLPSRATLTRDVCRHRQLKGVNDQNVDQYRETISGKEFLRIREADMLIFAAQGLFLYHGRSSKYTVSKS